MLSELGLHDVDISSAGTRALTGHGMDQPFAKRLSDRGIDASGFRSAQVRTEALERSAIIVTATRDHRREVVRLGNAFADRTFTLAQLSRLLRDESTPGERQNHPGTTTAADRAQGLVIAALAAVERRSLATAADDVEDPWRRSRRVHRRVADRIDELLVPIAARLAAGR